MAPCCSVRSVSIVLAPAPTQLCASFNLAFELRNEQPQHYLILTAGADLSGVSNNCDNVTLTTCAPACASSLAALDVQLGCCFSSAFSVV